MTRWITGSLLIRDLSLLTQNLIICRRTDKHWRLIREVTHIEAMWSVALGSQAPSLSSLCLSFDIWMMMTALTLWACCSHDTKILSKEYKWKYVWQLLVAWFWFLSAFPWIPNLFSSYACHSSGPTPLHVHEGSRMLDPKDNQMNLWVWPYRLNRACLAGMIKWRDRFIVILLVGPMKSQDSWSVKKEGDLVTEQEVGVRGRRDHKTECSHWSRGVREMVFSWSL